MNATKNCIGKNLVCSFCGMYAIPAYIVVGVSTSCCRDVFAVNEFAASAKSLRIKIVSTTPMSTTCFRAILETMRSGVLDELKQHGVSICIDDISVWKLSPGSA